MNFAKLRWIGLLVANLALVGMLGFTGNIGAAPKTTPQPFANPVEQNNEIIRELREIRLLLQEQNTLLRGGDAKSPARDTGFKSGR